MTGINQKGLRLFAVIFDFITSTSLAAFFLFALTNTYLTIAAFGQRFAFRETERTEKQRSIPNMKKQILLVAGVMISTLAISQSNISFGVRTGVTSSGIRGDAVNNLQNLLDFTNGMIATGDRTGFFVGGFASIPLASTVSVEPALYYTQKGYQMKGSLNLKGVAFLGANAKAELISNYIDIPVLIKANFNGLQLFGGPQFSYLMNADLKTTAGVLGFNLLNKKMDATSQFARTDFALTGGVGYQFTNGLNLMASYDYGLARVDANRNMNSYNRSMKVGIGMKF